LSIEACDRRQYEGYLDEKGVAPGSTTETFAEVKLRINNFRWAGVPICIRCGKALDRNSTEIGVRFKQVPGVLFDKQGPLASNTIVFMIQPQEGIILSMSSKEPGSELKLTNTNMTFCYHDAFEQEIPEAYQRILLDAIRGDHTLFVTARETELSWKVLENVLDKGSVRSYARGTVPHSAFDIQWIDFENYYGSCRYEAK
jgi:glucose-6-phosphate 1-dehydrogenase